MIVDEFEVVGRKVVEILDVRIHNELRRVVDGVLQHFFHKRNVTIVDVGVRDDVVTPCRLICPQFISSTTYK